MTRVILVAFAWLPPLAAAALPLLYTDENNAQCYTRDAREHISTRSYGSA